MAVEEQTKLLAFDRQNHMGASDKLAKSLSVAIQREAEAMLSKKKVVAGAVNIQQNADTMKVRVLSRTSANSLLCNPCAQDTS